MYYLSKNKERGFTLVELLIAMTIGLIILAALSSTFLIQRKAYDVQEQVAEMVQTARAAMDMMSREIRMAGYDPTASDGIDNDTDGSIDESDETSGAGIITVSTHSIRFTMDITGGESDGIDNDGDGNVDAADEDKFGDGDTLDSNEDITYSLYTADGIQKLGRKSTSTAVNQPVAENIEDLQISQTGNSINVSLIARTSKPDSNYTDPTYGDHYRRYTLSSVITPRNLDL